MKKTKIILLGLIGIILVIIIVQAIVIQSSIKKNYLEVTKKWTLLEKEISKENSDIENKYEIIENYNASIEVYNISIKKFPNKLYAKILGYNTKDYYIAKTANNDNLE